MNGQQPGTPTAVPGGVISRFSDTQHHITETAALEGSGFSKTQIEAIHRANTERDYSQVGRVGNALLLCQRKTFGGYKPEEHFDDVKWNAKVQQWEPRGSTSGPKRSPVDYINAQLTEFATQGGNDAGMAHIGNAFHTIEDFFAHSNFVELSVGDKRHGDELITAGGSPQNTTESLAPVLEGVSDSSVKPFYREMGREAESKAPAGSHARMSKDHLGKAYFNERGHWQRWSSRPLRDSCTRSLRFRTRTNDLNRCNRFWAQISGWLRLPNPKDPWWEKLKYEGATLINERLKCAEQTTPTTVNHCMFSPLRNFEASADMPMALMGIAIPMTVGQSTVWFQAGVGIIKPLPLERTGIPERQPEEIRPVAGAQIGVSF